MEIEKRGVGEWGLDYCSQRQERKDKDRQERYRSMKCEQVGQISKTHDLDMSLNNPRYIRPKTLGHNEGKGGGGEKVDQ